MVFKPCQQLAFYTTKYVTYLEQAVLVINYDRRILMQQAKNYIKDRNSTYSKRVSTFNRTALFRIVKQRFVVDFDNLLKTRILY